MMRRTRTRPRRKIAFIVEFIIPKDTTIEECRDYVELSMTTNGIGRYDLKNVTVRRYSPRRRIEPT